MDRAYSENGLFEFNECLPIIDASVYEGSEWHKDELRHIYDEKMEKTGKMIMRGSRFSRFVEPSPWAVSSSPAWPPFLKILERLHDKIERKIVPGQITEIEFRGKWVCPLPLESWYKFQMRSKYNLHCSTVSAIFDRFSAYQWCDKKNKYFRRENFQYLAASTDKLLFIYPLFERHSAGWLLAKEHYKSLEIEEK